MSTSEPSKEAQWFVMRTMPQHEKKLAKLLEIKGIEYYLPQVKRKRQWSDRVKMIDFPMFPGYIFVSIRDHEEFSKALKQPGNLGFIQRENKAVAIDADEIEGLRYLEQSSNMLDSEAARRFSPGQRVLINFGPFKGREAFVEKRKNNKRIFINYELFNRTISTEIDIVDITPLDRGL